MPEWSTIGLFVAASLALLVIPGPAVLYIITRAIHHGRRAGLVSALGVGLGNLVHVAAATLGISAVLASSALAFSAVKSLGAAYLVYLGVRVFWSRDESQVAAPEPSRLRLIFSQGFLVNALNPKTALFFLAFLPHFADPARGYVAVQILFLGGVFVSLAICSDSTYAVLAGTLGSRLRAQGRFLRAQRYVAAAVYIALGITAALAGSHGTR
ncbi:MAG: LysE family translocator [Armatimonadetes bacterium]|nr:LysE family translocator [Armatimonadota bacterium]